MKEIIGENTETANLCCVPIPHIILVECSIYAILGIKEINVLYCFALTENDAIYCILIELRLAMPLSIKPHKDTAKCFPNDHNSVPFVVCFVFKDFPLVVSP